MKTCFLFCCVNLFIKYQVSAPCVPGAFWDPEHWWEVKPGPLLGLTFQWGD